MPPALAAAPLPAAETIRSPGSASGRRLSMSRREYEGFSERAETKFEWVDGEAIEMSGSTVQHSDIKMNLYALLWAALRRRPGKANDSDLRVRTRNGAGPNRYPDASVTLEPQRFARHPQDKKLDLLNPTVLFEVLSDSTAEEDESGRKFEDYTATPSVTDYVLIDSRAVRVVHRTRPDAASDWAETILTRPDDVLSLPACGFAVNLAEIYEGTKLGG